MYCRQRRSQFLGYFLLGREIWMVGVVYLVVLACILRVANEKGQLFEEKSAS